MSESLLLCKQYAGVAVLHMCKKPVNSLNLDMLTSLTTALDKLEANRQCNALIITSVCIHLLQPVHSDLHHPLIVTYFQGC